MLALQPRAASVTAQAAKAGIIEGRVLLSRTGAGQSDHPDGRRPEVQPPVLRKARRPAVRTPQR